MNLEAIFNTPTFIAIITLWVMFDVVRTVMQWLKPKKTVQPPVAQLPDSFWDDLDEHILTQLIAFDESQVKNMAPMPPVAVVSGNGHKEINLEDANTAALEQMFEMADNPVIERNAIMLAQAETVVEATKQSVEKTPVKKPAPKRKRK